MAEKKELIKVYVSKEQKEHFKELAEAEGESISSYFASAALSRADIKKIEVKTDDITFIAHQLGEVERDIKLIVETAKETNSVVFDDVKKLEDRYVKLEKEIGDNLANIYKHRRSVKRETQKIVKEYNK